MFIIIVFAVSVFFMIAIITAASLAFTGFHTANSEIISNNIAAIASAIQYEAMENIAATTSGAGFAYPSKITGSRLNTTQTQYRHLEFHEPDRYKHSQNTYRTSTTHGVGDGLDANRMAIWFESPLNSFEGDDYLGENPCAKTGDDKKLDASHWCGRPNSLWAKIESNNTHLSLIESEQHRLYRLSRKFYRFYEAEWDFTHLGAINSSAPLFQYLVGAPALNAQSCNTTYRINSIPFDCQDLFNAWGEPIYLHILGINEIALTNVTGISHVSAGIAKPVRFEERIHIKND